LKGEVAAPKPKKHRVRKLFLLASVLGAAYAGWKAWAAKSAGDPAEPWTTGSSTPSYGSSTVTPVPTTSGPSTSRLPTDDQAGAGPDEALADAADEAKAEEEPTTGGAVTTEPVTPKNARKASDAAKKSASRSASKPS
ncbi:MAG: hypothetical protein ACRDV2_09705, partial [Actinomycetes bacterium]